MSSEDIDNLIKAKNALSEVPNMIITTNRDFDGNNICEIIFGDNTGFSNKISYKMNGNIKDPNISLPFNSDIFKDILNANKDQNQGSLKLSKSGILKFNFNSDEIESEYFVARNE